MDIWMVAFFLAYGTLMVVLYKAWLQKIILALRNRGWYYHYHIIDSGIYGDAVFCDGVTLIAGTERTFDRSCILDGTLFYEEGNAEPVKIKRDAGNLDGGRYKYYCDTKNFHSVAKSDALETLLILRGKEMIIALIFIVIGVALLGAIINGYLTYSSSGDVQATLEIIKNQTAQQSGIVISP